MADNQPTHSKYINEDNKQRPQQDKNTFSQQIELKELTSQNKKSEINKQQKIGYQQEAIRTLYKLKSYQNLNDQEMQQVNQYYEKKYERDRINGRGSFSNSLERQIQEYKERIKKQDQLQQAWEKKMAQQYKDYMHQFQREVIKYKAQMEQRYSYIRESIKICKAKARTFHMKKKQKTQNQLQICQGIEALIQKNDNLKNY